MVRANLLRWLIAATLLVIAACGDDNPPGGAGADDTADGGVVLFDAGAADGLQPRFDAVADTGLRGACPGGAGCPCLGNGDCDSAICLDTPGGKACASPCVDTCPSGYLCTSIPLGADFVQACVSVWARLCHPCQDNADCQSVGVVKGRCVPSAQGGSYCGAGCELNTDCPGNYACEEVMDVEGSKGKQCVLKDAAAACVCNGLAVDLEAKTSCLETVEIDGRSLTCSGSAKCDEVGKPAACSVGAPQAESCNGVDDDCDGETDEGSCDDNNPCTQDACEPKTGCKNVPMTNGQACDADASVCTEGDSCVDGVCVAGKPLSCDDQNPCTKDSCEPAGGCTQTNFDGIPCDDSNPCTVGDVCASGGCVPGKPKVCTSTEPCKAAECAPSKGGDCAFTLKPDGALCDDGNACTVQDACKAGVCAGQGLQCDDSNPCTADGCGADGKCSHTATAGPCEDNDACTVNDTCKDKVCSPGAAKVCDDANPCTADTCAPSTGCLNKPIGGACDDGDVCTQSDTCQQGVCKGGVQKACDDSNFCTDDGCDPKTGCTYKANTAPCEDGDGCTEGDLCANKVCTAGKPKSCDDGNPCTKDTCAQGVCSSSQVQDGTQCAAAKWCVGGLCAPKGLGKSCAEIKAKQPGAKDGVYPVDPDADGPLPTVEVFCDMTGGGWTLVGNFYDTASNDMPDSADFVVTGWRSTGSGKFAAGAVKVDRTASSAGNSAVSLAWVAGLVGGGAQDQIKVCLVYKSGGDSVCRSSFDGSLTPVSYVSGNPSLTKYKSNKFVYTFGRLAGLAGAQMSYTNLQGGKFGIPRKEGKAGEFGIASGSLVDKDEDPQCVGDGGPWHGSGCGISYRPHRTGFDELSTGACCLIGGGHPVDSSYGFRIYVGPSPSYGSQTNPGSSCKDIRDKGSAVGTGQYWIKPDGGALTYLTCDMETDGGGWTQMTNAIAPSLKAGVSRQYLYKKGEAWFLSPATKAVWSWTSGQEAPGSWSWSDGNQVGSFVCLGSSEKPSVGVGCSSGATKLTKVLPILPFDKVDGTTKVCQQQPNAYGGKLCEPDVQIYVR